MVKNKKYLLATVPLLMLWSYLNFVLLCGLGCQKVVELDNYIDSWSQDTAFTTPAAIREVPGHSLLVDFLGWQSLGIISEDEAVARERVKLANRVFGGFAAFSLVIVFLLPYLFDFLLSLVLRFVRSFIFLILSFLDLASYIGARLRVAKKKVELEEQELDKKLKR